MKRESRKRVESVACDQPDPGAHLDQGFESFCSGLQQVLVGGDPSVLGQKNDGRPTQSEVAFLAAADRRSVLVRLDDAADSQRANFDLQHTSANCVGKHADHALVSKTRCAGSQRDRMHRVQSVPDTNGAGRLAINREMKAVVIAGCQSNYEHSAGNETIQSADQVVKVDSKALNAEFASRQLAKCQYPTFGGCDHVVRVAIDRSRFGFELPCEKCIQRSVAASGKLGLGRIDSVPTNKVGNLFPAPRRPIQQTGEMTKPCSLDKRMQKQCSPPCLIKNTEFAFAVDPLSSNLPRFAVEKIDRIARRTHMLFTHSSGKSDCATDSIAEYRIASIDPASPEFNDFATLPHARSLNSLAPSAADVTLQLGADSLFYRHGEARLFACYRDGQLVGRAVASVDHHFPDPDVGHFGYFETTNDKSCAEKLMQACEEWLRNKGKKRIEGPVNLNMLAGYRVQTAGFDTRAFPGEPRNPDYYPNLLGSLGYREVALWQSWDISSLALLGLRAIDWLQRSRRRATRNCGYRIEELRTDRLEEETRKIHRLVHEIFADNYGFSAIDLAEHMQMQGSAMDGSAKVAGAFLYHSTNPEPIGFSYGFYMGPVGIFHTFGVTKAHRGTGGADLLFHQGLQEIKSQGVSRAIGALAKAGKSKYERIGRPRRAYAVLGRDL